MGRKLSKVILLAVFFSFVSSGSVNAAQTPSFPSCVAPQGVLKAQYSSGTHGIPGNTDEHRGSDSVYQVSDTTLVQCFCSENGSGTQTNWWKVSSLSQNEIAVLKSEGWILIPDGSAWGLDQGEYLTKNSSYQCSSSGGIGGPVAGAGQVLGLATTGNIAIIYLLFILGSVFVGSEILLRKIRS